jgi:hypothetical protein
MNAMPEASVRDLTARLEQGVRELFESDKYAEYLKTMSRFHAYSTRNTLLIHLQDPTARRVAGYTSWKTNFNRQVKKGERGIKIFAPIANKGKDIEAPKLDPITRQPILDENGQSVMERLSPTSNLQIRFKLVTVFSERQTEGDPLPELAETLTGDVERYELFMDTLRAVSPLPIVFEQLPEDTDGTCRFGDRIAIREGMSEIQTVSAVIHEMTHSKLHDLNTVAENGEQAKDRRTQEVEAEGVSYVVNSHFNVDTGANIFGYVATWSKDKELKELNTSLDTIRKTAASLIDAISVKYRELAKERGIDLSVVTDESGAEQNLNMIDGVINNELPKAEETPPEAAPEIAAPVPTIETEPPSESAANAAEPDILAGYARYAEIRDPRQVGLTVLMPLLYEDGNLNRESKRSRVKVKPPIGKYEIFSHDVGTPPHQTNYLYLTSASGYLVQLGETERLENLTEQKLDTFVLDAITKLDRQLSDEAEWADFAAAALLNRIDEAEAHNRPVRELREAEYRAEHAARTESDKRLAAEKQQILTARVDEIAKAIETGSKIQVAYSAGEHQGKNPVLELFKLYGVEIPLRTQGWVNNKLAAISGEGYSYYKQNGGRPSAVFMNCLRKLTAEIKRTPIDRMRGMPLTAKATENTEVKDTLEHQLYEKFAAMFPAFMNGEYETLRLEAEHAKPLELEWVFGDAISIAHTYELNGEPVYEPRVMLTVNSEEKTLTAHSLELTKPPRMDDVYGNNGITDFERQRNINDFTLQWLDRAEKQRFRPIEATYCVDEQGNVSREGLITDKTVKVTFDAEGNPLLPGLGVKPPNIEMAADTQGKAISAAERGLYAKFAELFPDFAERKYSYMRLESDGFEPLSLEWPGTDTISVMHTYTMNGDLMYDPMVTFSVDREAKTMTAAEFQQSLPPLYQTVTENGDGLSVDGNGNQRDIRGLQRQINEFASNWFGNLVAQEYMPIKAHLVIGEHEKTEVTFDADGNMTMPEAEPDVTERSEPSKPNPMFPDPTVTPAERDAYGYTESDMHPLGRDKALELFDAGQTVYLLYPDNTEAMAFDRDEIITFTGDGGLCGVSHADWQFSGEFKTQAILSGFREDALESDLLFGSESRFGIYQIPGYIDDYRDVRFVSISELEAKGLTPDRNNYKLVYTAPLTIHDTQTNAHKIFADFQHDSPECPSDFTERSVSVGDVIVLQWRGEVSAHFVDSIGFKELPIFTGNEREQKPPETLSQIATNSNRKHAGPQEPAGKKPPDTLLGELAEAKNAVASGNRPGAHKSNEREV